MADEPAADSILSAVATAYRGFVEYQDAGVVTGKSVTTVRFETQFRRGSSFRFSYKATLADGRQYHDGEVALQMGQFTFRCSLSARPPTSFRLAIAALTGISGGSAHAIPSLLLPEEVGGWLPTDLKAPIRLQDKLVRGKACFQIQGYHPSLGTKSLLVVDRDSYLILELVPHDDAQVTNYESCRAT